MRAHQAAVQSIADANGGTRASGTPGFDASAYYVKRQLETAGYTVIQMPFKFRLSGRVHHRSCSKSTRPRRPIARVSTSIPCNIPALATSWPCCRIRTASSFRRPRHRAAPADATRRIWPGNPGRTDVFIGTLGGPVDIPVLSASFKLGAALALSRPSMHLKTDTASETR